MKLTLDISVKAERGLPLMFLTAQKDGKVLDLKYDPALTLSDLFEKFEGMADDKERIIEPLVQSLGIERGTRPVPASQPDPLPEAEPVPVKDNSQTIQREDLVQVTNLIPGLKDEGGNELVDRGIIQGGIYRVMKINQNVLVLPDKPDEMTTIVNSYEVIDDKSAIPRRLSVFPHEVQLYKKRLKDKSIKTGKVSELLKCSACGKENAFVLDGSSFVGKCADCAAENKIERVIEKCVNEKCVDTGGVRSSVALYHYGEEYSGQCGTCKTAMSKKYDGYKPIMGATT